MPNRNREGFQYSHLPSLETQIVVLSNSLSLVVFKSLLKWQQHSNHSKVQLICIWGLCHVPHSLLLLKAFSITDFTFFKKSFLLLSLQLWLSAFLLPSLTLSFLLFPGLLFSSIYSTNVSGETAMCLLLHSQQEVKWMWIPLPWSALKVETWYGSNHQSSTCGPAMTVCDRSTGPWGDQIKPAASEIWRLSRCLWTRWRCEAKTPIFSLRQPHHLQHPWFAECLLVYNHFHYTSHYGDAL